MVRKAARECSKTKEDQLSQAAKAAFDWFSTRYGAFTIKKQEKEGKEWMESYLPGAFDEAEELIGAARKRKGFDKKKSE